MPAFCRCSLIVTRARPRLTVLLIGYADKTNRRESLCLNAYLMNHRVAAGLEDYAPDDVPPAADPPPPGVSEAVDLAERGLLGDTSIDTPDR